MRDWHWHLGTKDIALESLFPQNTKFCFLAGSGISLDPPSNLPTGYQFTKALLNQLIPQEKLSEVLQLMRPEREEMQGLGDFLRFEQLMGYLQRQDRNLHVLDLYARCKTPNFNHLFLAHMILLKHPVFTTNFDNLIEYALMDLKIPQKGILPVIYRDQWEKSAEQRRPQGHYVYKLHGSLINTFTQRDCRDSLQATINQIFKWKGTLFQLEPWKKRVFEPILKNYDLVVLGYSGLDDFDILPTLWDIKSAKRILWINHDPDRSVTHAQIRVLTDQTSSQKTSDTTRVMQNLLKFVKLEKRQPNKLVIITVNTVQLLHWLWKRYLPHFSRPTIPSEPATPLSKPKIALKSTMMNKWFLTAIIFMGRHRLASSLQAFQKVLDLIENDPLQKSPNLQKLKGVCLRQIGHIYYVQGPIDSAVQVLQQALAIAEHQKDVKRQSIVLNTLGYVLRGQGRSDEALEHLQKALYLSRQLKHRTREATCLKNIGNIYSDKDQFDKALDYYQQALEIQELPGAKSTLLINIGNLYYKQNKLDDALKAHTEAYHLDLPQGNLHGRLNAQWSLGCVYYSQGELELALFHLQEVLKLCELMQTVHRQIGCLNRIALIQHIQNYSDKALAAAQQALSLAEQNDFPSGKARALINIGRIFYTRKHYKKAIDSCQQALTITEQQNDLPLLAEIKEIIISIKNQKTLKPPPKIW